MENRTPKGFRGHKQRTWGQRSTTALFRGVSHEVVFPPQKKWQNFVMWMAAAQTTLTGIDSVNQKDKYHTSLDRPVTAGKGQKFVTRAGLLPWSRFGTLKTRAHVFKSLSVSFSCISWSNKRYLSFQLSPWKWESSIKKDSSLNYPDLFCLCCFFSVILGESCTV